ncbi:hypothetical protein [Chitinimonas lacunae]|uniref:Uncharacterized protein n=1 Tax=Chitinimonas lacunae TaxID=1963018 RepID=A0ABV8MNT0_9NEIS
MSGSILISDSENTDDGGVGFAYNTSVFQAIAEGIRIEFEGSASECMKECFEELDEMGSEYICLYDVKPCCFREFVGACERGLRKLQAKRELVIDYEATDAEIDGIATLWEELLATLHMDPRMTAS